mmetsp:Transcript_76239/g.163552  ORF Transcript_76239/g.163552 Transcript_76239/m.163552 type:complete len:229 (+) Transcript_76239:1710-2396(+)
MAKRMARAISPRVPTLTIPPRPQPRTTPTPTLQGGAPKSRHRWRLHRSGKRGFAGRPLLSTPTRAGTTARTATAARGPAARVRPQGPRRAPASRSLGRWPSCAPMQVEPPAAALAPRACSRQQGPPRAAALTTRRVSRRGSGSIQQASGISGSESLSTGRDTWRGGSGSWLRRGRSTGRGMAVLSRRRPLCARQKRRRPFPWKTTGPGCKSARHQSTSRGMSGQRCWP